MFVVAEAARERRKIENRDQHVNRQQGYDRHEREEIGKPEKCRKNQAYGRIANMRGGGHSIDVRFVVIR